MLSTLAQLLKMPISEFKQVVKKAMKLNNKALEAAVGCYAQLKP
jgi:hypothetical protein